MPDVSSSPSSPIEPFRPLPERTWRERLDDALERLRAAARPLHVAAGVGAALCVVIVAVALLRPAGAGPAPEATLPRASEAPPASVAAPSSGGGALVVVQAAGAVQRPGLFRLPSGARVDDLVTAAGGLAPDADPDRLNLAAPLVDGQKIYVPRRGEPIPPDVAPAATAGAESAAPVDLNQATLQQLDSLPGIGPATAQAIIDYRTQHGRFRSVDDLLNVRGIGDAKLEQLRPLVRVA